MKEIITKKDIALFFDVEAESAQKKQEQFMALPIEERIRKRRAINNVYWDSEYNQFDDSNRLYRLTVSQNLSDFKVGDALLLHKEDYLYGQECQLYEYDEDDNIIISVYNSILNESWQKVPLVLDKNVIDLREPVFEKYLALENGNDDYWTESLINSEQLPNFDDLESCKKDLRETEEWLPSSLTTKQRDAVLKCMSTDSYYMIQGPPGTGKSFVLGVVILEELLDFKKSVLVVGPNHLAINNTLMQVLNLMPEYSKCIIKVGQSYYAKDLFIEKDDKKVEMTHCGYLNVEYCNQADIPILYGMTPYSLYTSRARGLEFDTLVIDEAGQLTIPLAQMAMRLSKKVILAGDHKQLSPIVAEEIDPKMKESIFQRIMAPGKFTMLDTTFRMCGPICSFVSELFYDGQLVAKNPQTSTLIQGGGELYSFSYPVVLFQVIDYGKQVSEKETTAIMGVIEKYCCELGLLAEKIAVLSPFRAQVADIRRRIRRIEKLDKDIVDKIVVDTIDKLQGQERDVVIISMAAGDLNYMNEMGDFLYNPNKLNVAFSRAKSKLIIVGNFNAMKELSNNKYPHVSAMLKSKIPYFVEFGEK